jgi:hypothetical protein
MSYNGPKYTKVRNDFLERRDLSITQKIILVYLHGRMRSDGQPWEVSSDQIRQALNLGHDATDKALSGLKDGGWITDNRAAVRGKDGRIRRPRSTVIDLRRPEVVAITDVSAGRTESGHPGDGFPDRVSPTVMKNYQIKNYRDETAQVGPSKRDESSDLLSSSSSSHRVERSDFSSTPRSSSPLAYCGPCNTWDFDHCEGGNCATAQRETREDICPVCDTPFDRSLGYHPNCQAA